MDDFENYDSVSYYGGDDGKQIFASQMQEDKINNLISQLAPENVLFLVEQRLRGKRKNPETNVWEEISPNMKKLPDSAIGRYLGFLSPFLNFDVVMCNLSAQEINALMKNINRWIIDDISTHAEEYDVENDYTERTRILFILASSVYFVLKRALNGQEASRFWKSVTLREFGGGGSGEKKKGFMETLKFWK